MLIYLGTFAASVGIAAYGEHLRTKKNNEKGFYLCLALAVLVMAVLAGLRDPSIGTDSVVYEGWVADANISLLLHSKTSLSPISMQPVRP